MNIIETLEYHMHHWNLIAEAQKARPREYGNDFKRVIAELLNVPRCVCCYYAINHCVGVFYCCQRCPIDWPGNTGWCMGYGSPYYAWTNSEYPDWRLALEIAILGEEALDRINEQ
jgi:hypothetical protein